MAHNLSLIVRPWQALSWQDVEVKVLYAVKFSQQPRPRVMYVTREGSREAFTGEPMGWVLSGE